MLCTLGWNGLSYAVVCIYGSVLDHVWVASLSLSVCVCVVYVDIRFRYRVEEYRLMTEVYSNMIGIKCVYVYLCSRLESVKLDKYSFQLLKLLKR